MCRTVRQAPSPRIQVLISVPYKKEGAATNRRLPRDNHHEDKGPKEQPRPSQISQKDKNLQHPAKAASIARKSLHQQPVTHTQHPPARPRSDLFRRLLETSTPALATRAASFSRSHLPATPAARPRLPPLRLRAEKAAPVALACGTRCSR